MARPGVDKETGELQMARRMNASHPTQDREGIWKTNLRTNQTNDINQGDGW